MSGSLASTAAAAEHEAEEAGARLWLPSDSEEQWAQVQEVLSAPVTQLADLDKVLTAFSASDEFPKVCTFFATVPGSPDAGAFDFDVFFAKAVPLMLELALETPMLFAGMRLPIFKTRSAEHASQQLNRKSVTLTCRQCACLLVHSFFGSLKRPKGVERNNFRFTAVELFMGSAVSPNSAVTLLNYFKMLAVRGIPEASIAFERRGFRKGTPPWQWEDNEKPLCQVDIVDGNIEDSSADVHAEFANAFIGGGVMTGDFAMEELLFLIKPELMVAMALQNRMTDTEAICMSGARQYSLISGYGSSFEFAGDYDDRRPGPPPTDCAIDAIRGGGPAMTKVAMLRDMDKARIAFDGAREVSTGHWGCGAFGNNHDLMFLKQWLAASEAGVQKVFYHDFDRRQSHNVHPLVRNLKHLTVGQLWDLLQSITGDLVPCKMAEFTTRMRSIARGELERCPTTGKYQLRRASVSSVAPPPAPAADKPFEGKTVVFKEEEMLCIKETEAQLRLQRADGKTTWAGKTEVTLRA